MTVFLVRHALAVPRSAWSGDDRRRPITKRGLHQAAGLVDLLADVSVERIVSSPARRCRQTVAPFGTARGLSVKTSQRLAEGRGGDTLDLVLDAVEDVLFCTHGDVVEEVLSGLRSLGWPVPTRPRNAKGSAWLLRRDGPCDYLPPAA
jgi:phosphohistidine phosphatase SixA